MCEREFEANQFARERFLYWLQMWTSAWYGQVLARRVEDTMEALEDEFEGHEVH